MRTRFRELRATLPPAYWTVWVGTLINRAGAFVVPVLTFYLTERRGLSLATAGSLLATYGVGTVIAALVGGMLADRLGRKVTMVGSLFGAAIMMTVLSMATTPLTIAPTVLVLAIVGDLYRPAVNAFVADIVPPEHRQSAYGMMYWAINIGFSIAPMAAGIVATLSYRALFIGDAATSAIFATIILLRVPESHPDLERKHISAGGVAAVLEDRGFMWYWACSFLHGTIVFQLLTTLSGWMSSQGFGPGAYGAILSINGILIVLFQPALSEWSKHFDRRNVMAAAALLTGFGFMLHGVTALIWVHALAVATWTLGEIVYAPASSAYIADRAPTLLRGRYQGIAGMSGGVASIVATVIGPRVLEVSPVALWGGCALLGVLAAVGYRVMR